MPEQSDETTPLNHLVARAQSGDPDALAPLLKGLQDSIFRFSVSQLRDPEAAGDATQETAMRMLANLKNFRGASSAKTWALGIALNVCREMRRSQQRHEASLESQDHWNVAGSDVEANTLKREDIERMTSMVECLPERQREAITLRYFEELGIEQTAEVMGAATGTVKATIWQALRSLRRRLGE